MCTIVDHVLPLSNIGAWHYRHWKRPIRRPDRPCEPPPLQEDCSSLRDVLFIVSMRLILQQKTLLGINFIP